MAVERHYTPEQAAPLLGFPQNAGGAESVRMLVRRKKLLARKRDSYRRQEYAKKQGKPVTSVKDTRRLLIPESAIKRYLDSLEATNETPAAEASASSSTGASRRGPSSRMRGIKSFV